MTNKRFLALPLVALVATVTFLTVAKPSLAFSFEDIVTGAKEFILGGEKKELTLDSKIELAPGGDVEKNNQIDAGDILRFTYTITNTTENEYSFTTLNTHINRSLISFIHNVYGATGITNDEKAPAFTNVRIGANEQAVLSFDARINYLTDSDPTISSEAEFVNKDKKTILKATKKEIKAKRISENKIPGLIKIDK